MIVAADKMAKAVRVAIDMNRGDDPLFMEGDSDTLTLDEIIFSKLAEGVRLVEMEAPPALLESGHDFAGCAEACPGNKNPTRECSHVFWGEDGKGFIILPHDFMRLIAFRMSDWHRTVFDAISETDPEYALQSSRFKGICGNPEKPVVAIVRRSEGLVLEFYSCRDKTATVTQATYIPVPKIDEDGGIDVAEMCYQAAVYRTASLVLASLGDQLSTTMAEISRSLLQN